MLTGNVVKKLNEQVTKEMFSSNLYVSMSGWCYRNKLEGAGEFLSIHALEERTHADKLITYLNETDSCLDLSAIEKPESSFNSLLDVFEKTLKHELFITQSINDLVTLTFEERDYSTFNFLQWYVAEQHEEEALFRGIVDKIKLIGEGGNGLFLADQYIKSLVAKHP